MKIKLPKISFPKKSASKAEKKTAGKAAPKKRKKLFVILAVLIVIILIVSFFFFRQRRRQMPDFDMSATVETAQITRQTLTNSISATGTIESAETKTVNTGLSELEVSAVYVKEGDYVEEGTIICEFDASDFEEELAKARNNQSVNEQIANLEDDYQTVYNETVSEANETLENLRDARDYYKDQYNDSKDAEEAARQASESASASLKALCEQYGIDSAAVTAALSKPDTDYAALFTPLDETLKTEENTANFVAAVKSAAEKASAYTTAQQTTAQFQSAYESAQDERERYQDTYDQTIEKAEYDYNKAALEEQLISETQEEKTISDYEERIDDCVIKADMSGVITSLNVTEGNVFEGGNIYTIQDNNNFIVSASVDEYDIINIEKGMSAYIKTDATGDTEMEGTVTYVAIAPESGNTGGMGAISNSGSYRIEVTINNPSEDLRAGMTGKVSIALEESKDTLTVPYDAVTSTPAGSTITVDDNGEKKTIDVTIGLETDYYTEIFSDEISEGMTVYLSTPMIQSGTDRDEEFTNPFENGGMPGGMTGGGNRGGDGGMGGGPGGGGMPGGF